MGKRVIISVSSDIGISLANRWINEGHQIIGTYRTESPSTKMLSEAGVELVYANLSNPQCKDSL